VIADATTVHNPYLMYALSGQVRAHVQVMLRVRAAVPSIHRVAS